MSRKCIHLNCKCFCAVFRVQVWCLSTCSWSDTQQRKSISLGPASTGRAWATARITRVSSCTLMPGREAAARQTSPARPRYKWTPATLPSSSVQTMTRCPPPPAEGPHTRDAWTVVGQDRVSCAIVDQFLTYICCSIRQWGSDSWNVSRSELDSVLYLLLSCHSSRWQ